MQISNSNCNGSAAPPGGYHERVQAAPSCGNLASETAVSSCWFFLAHLSMQRRCFGMAMKYIGNLREINSCRLD